MFSCTEAYSLHFISSMAVYILGISHPISSVSLYCLKWESY